MGVLCKVRNKISNILFWKIFKLLMTYQPLCWSYFISRNNIDKKIKLVILSNCHCNVISLKIHYMRSCINNICKKYSKETEQSQEHYITFQLNQYFSKIVRDTVITIFDQLCYISVIMYL